MNIKNVLNFKRAGFQNAFLITARAQTDIIKKIIARTSRGKLGDPQRSRDYILNDADEKKREKRKKKGTNTFIKERDNRKEQTPS